MSHTLSLPDIQRRDPIFAWLGLILLAHTKTRRAR